MSLKPRMRNRPLKFSKTARLAVGLFLNVFFVLLVSGVCAAGVPRQSAEVHEVLTGDTVRLKGGKTLRYAGLQAPPRQSAIPLLRQYGEASFEFNRNFVEGHPVFLEWDAQIRNERGELLGYVFLEDGTFVNLKILDSGQAKFHMPPPNKRYAADLRQAELGARRAKRGLWKEEPENPYIKDEYLGEKNTKIYYFPTPPELDRIPEANLVKFRSRVEAKAAGYRPCSTCKEDERIFE